MTNCAVRVLVVADAAAEPAGPRWTPRCPVRRRRRGGRASSVVLRRTRRGVEEPLVRGEAGERLRLVERADPLALARDRDRAAVVVDEAHRDVPVRARDVDRREGLGLVLRAELLGAGGELGEARRDLPPACLEQVGAVGDDARARVVRNAVDLAAELPRRREARRARCSCSGTRSPSESWNAPAAMYFVISVFPISMTSGVFRRRAWRRTSRDGCPRSGTGRRRPSPGSGP